jgi:hypothetical protein
MKKLRTGHFVCEGTDLIYFGMEIESFGKHAQTDWGVIMSIADAEEFIADLTKEIKAAKGIVKAEPTEQTVTKDDPVRCECGEVATADHEHWT